MAFFQATDGTSIFYNDWGTGAPVVLIHGWPLSSASWEYQAGVLAEKGHRVIAYDRRGFGKSDQPFSGYDYDTFAADLDTLMTGLDLQGVTLVGFSMGGGEVARYLGTYGEARVKKAVLISAVPPYMLKTADNPEGVEQKVFDRIIENIKKDRPAFMRQFAASFYGRTMINHTVSEDAIDFFVMMAMQASPKATLECVTAFSATDFRSDLAKITVPTLIIHGTSDATVPIDVSGRRSAKLVAHAQFIEYDGEAHGLNATAPDKLNADLLSFLNDSDKATVA
jgi:non-heme chloroperoxidase